MKNCLYRRFIIVLAATLAFTGCSSTPDDSYLASRSTHALEIPPNLSQPVVNPEFTIPGISSQQTTYSGYTSAGSQDQDILPKLGKDVKFVRDGNIAWLDIAMSPRTLWPVVKSFVGKSGFEIKYANRLTGTIDTSWRENKDGASWMTTLTSGEQGTYMDKYRLRLEHGEDNKHTLLFIRHKGARIVKDVVNADLWDDEEDSVTIDEEGAKKTLWISRPSDPDLETEMLRNFMVYLGLGEDAVDKELGVYSHKNIANIIKQDKGLALEVQENFPRTWRRIGLALDRMGFVVDDRNRSAGVYYISLPKQFETQEEKTWFNRLFEKDRAEVPSEYLLSVTQQGEETRVTIRSRASAALDPKVAEKILRQIQAHIS